MNDKNDITRRLIKESMAKTTDDFTDQVMSRIDTSSSPALISAWQLGALVLSFTVVCVTLFLMNKLEWSMLSWLGTNSYLPPLSIEIIAVIFVLFAVNEFMSLREYLKILRHTKYS
jgi:hypothetical protein